MKSLIIYTNFNLVSDVCIVLYVFVCDIYSVFRLCKILNDITGHVYDYIMFVQLIPTNRN